MWALLLRREVIIPALVIAAFVGWGEYRAGIARDAARAELARAYQETIERMNDADIPSDPADVVERLRRLSE